MNAYESTLEKLNLSFKPGSPDDPPYPEPEFFLRGCPRGNCPWCKVPIVSDYDTDEGWMMGHPFVKRPTCNWDESDSEDENRIRYAAERLEDTMLRHP